jgi:hypothetical protein
MHDDNEMASNATTDDCMTGTKRMRYASTRVGGGRGLVCAHTNAIETHELITFLINQCVG